MMTMTIKEIKKMIIDIMIHNGWFWRLWKSWRFSCGHGGDNFDHAATPLDWTGSRGGEPGLTTSPSSSSVLHSFKRAAASRCFCKAVKEWCQLESMQVGRIQFLMRWEMSTGILCIQAPKTNSEKIKDSCKAVCAMSSTKLGEKVI